MLHNINVPQIENTGIAKVSFIKSEKTGRTTKKISELINEDEGTLALKFDKIVYSNTIYLLKQMVLFPIYFENSDCTIENEQLDIFASGKNKYEAALELFKQFDHSYKRLNELENNQLSPRFLRVKKYFNFIIKKVISG